MGTKPNPWTSSNDHSRHERTFDADAKTPEPKVVAWMDGLPRTSVWTTSITVLEVRFGLQILPQGKRKSLLEGAFDAVLDRIGQRVVPFDIAAARKAGDLMAARQKSGRPVDLRDTMIAGIVLSQRATLATRNTMHFADISAPVLNPWTV